MLHNCADMAELADAMVLGAIGRPCRFESCYPQGKVRCLPDFLIFSFYILVSIPVSTPTGSSGHL